MIRAPTNDLLTNPLKSCLAHFEPNCIRETQTKQRTDFFYYPRLRFASIAAPIGRHRRHPHPITISFEKYKRPRLIAKSMTFELKRQLIATRIRRRGGGGRFSKRARKIIFARGGLITSWVMLEFRFSPQIPAQVISNKRPFKLSSFICLGISLKTPVRLHTESYHTSEFTGGIDWIRKWCLYVRERGGAQRGAVECIRGEVVWQTS
jgi:hypothetical protein